MHVAEKSLKTYHETFRSSPITITKPLNENNGLVFIAHGFAGSAAIMKPIAVALAKSGYTTIRYDFRGHGKHPLPYSGEVTNVTGATRLFLNDTDAIIKHYINLSSHSKAVLIGHSMASDIIFRAANLNNSISGAIGISSYTDVISDTSPKNVLILNGEWESRLRRKALKTLKELGITAPSENVTYGTFESETARRTSAIKNVGHFGVLYSPETQFKIISWVDKVYGASRPMAENYIGAWTGILLASLFISFCIFTQTLKKTTGIQVELTFRKLFIGNLVAAVITPAVLYFSLIDFVRFPAHNYLINHLFLYSLTLSFFLPIRELSVSWKPHYFVISGTLFAFFALVLGGIIDSYISTFSLTNSRLKLFFLLIIVCVPLMLVIQTIYQAKKGRLLMGNITKSCLVLSLVVPISLNFVDFFLLGYAIFLIICFFIVFGFLSNLLSSRIGNIFPIGLTNGITLAWTLSTALPLYIP